MRAKPKLFFGLYISCHPFLLLCGLHTLMDPGIAGPASPLSLHHWVPQGAHAPISTLGFQGRTVTSQAFSLGMGGIAQWLAMSVWWAPGLAWKGGRK